MMHILSASHCGGRWFRPGLTHRQDCQLPVPFFLAGLPGLVSFAIAKISEGLIFFTETFHKRYIFQYCGHGFLAKGRTRRYDQMCAGESIQINYVFFVIMSQVTQERALKSSTISHESFCSFPRSYMETKARLVLFQAIQITFCWKYWCGCERNAAHCKRLEGNNSSLGLARP